MTTKQTTNKRPSKRAGGPDAVALYTGMAGGIRRDIDALVSAGELDRGEAAQMLAWLGALPF